MPVRRPAAPPPPPAQAPPPAPPPGPPAWSRPASRSPPPPRAPHARRSRRRRKRAGKGAGRTQEDAGKAGRRDGDSLFVFYRPSINVEPERRLCVCLASEGGSAAVLPLPLSVLFFIFTKWPPSSFVFRRASILLLRYL